MVREQGSLQGDNYEQELVDILEDAVRREGDARDYYLKSAQNPHNRPETTAMFELLAAEEARHAAIITGRLEENRMRLKAIAWKGPYGVVEPPSPAGEQEP